MPEENRQYIWIEDSDGNEVECEILGTFEIEDRIYIALLPKELVEENEALVMSVISGPKGEALLRPIEEDESEDVFEAFHAIFNGEIAEEEEAEESSVKEVQKDSDKQPEEETEDYCYEDEAGNLFYYGEDGSKIYINEYGEPIE
ncbi:MAG: DUF1292 domain-containing protein [Monoglobales bacterium]